MNAIFNSLNKDDQETAQDAAQDEKSDRNPLAAKLIRELKKKYLQVLETISQVY